MLRAIQGRLASIYDVELGLDVEDFVCDEETARAYYDTIDPAAAYAPGIRLALEAARDLQGVVIGLDALIDIGIRLPGAPGSGAGIDEGGVPGQVARTTGA